MESAKMLILNNKQNSNFKAVLNLKVDTPSLIKFYNLSEGRKTLALGIKQRENIVKVPLKLEEGNYEFNLPKSINLNEKLFCAIVDVTNAFCPEIVLSGSLNSEAENSTIESAFVTSKPQDTSVLYEEEEDEKIEEIIDKNLEEDASSVYYDNCASCRYRKAFYDDENCACSSVDTPKNPQNSPNFAQSASSSEIINNKRELNSATNNGAESHNLLNENLQNKTSFSTSNHFNNTQNLTSFNGQTFEDCTSFSNNKADLKFSEENEIKTNECACNQGGKITSNAETTGECNQINSAETFGENNLDSSAESCSETYDEPSEENENLLEDNLNNTREPESFYEQIKPQLDTLFNKYSPEEVLGQVIANSKWVKVNYDGGVNYYVLGLVFDDNKNNVEYIAYGMPSTDSQNAPDDLAGFAQWLPLNNLNGANGYWIVYQDAKTGETIKVNFI